MQVRRLQRALTEQEEQMADSLGTWHGIEAEHSNSMSRLQAALKQSSTGAFTGTVRAAQRFHSSVCVSCGYE